MQSYERKPASDARKVRRLASEKGLASYMNRRKWLGVFALFKHWSDPPPRFRVFDLLLPADVSPWCRQWHHFPRPLISVHWMEIELPRADVPRVIEEIKARRIPADQTDAGVRIWGWVGGTDRTKLI